MDPASAAVAFVGFAASLATLVAVVIDTSKTIYNLGSKLRHAPKDVERLLFEFEIFGGLLKEIRSRAEEHGDANTPPGLRELWAVSASQMQNDMENFQSVILKLSVLLKGTISSSALVRLRIRSLFSESAVTRYRQQITAHHGILTLVQSLMSE